MTSRTAGNALRAAICIAQRESPEPVTAQALAAELDLPRNYLSKTLHRLVQGGVLRAIRGRGGGFRLAALPAEISLQRVIHAIDPDGPERRCLLGRPECLESRPCATHHRWCEVRATVDRFFAETTLGDLLAPAPALPGRA